MSDYLWDGKGEPDADVARLEALLGAFKHAPRPLELPAGAETPEPRPPRPLTFAPRLRASRLLAPAALAAAAALVVASVLVASAFLRARVANQEGRAAARESARPEGDAPKDERAAPRAAEQAMLEPPPPARGATDETPSIKAKVKGDEVSAESLAPGARRRRGAQPAPAPGRRQKVSAGGEVEGVAGAGLTLEAMRAGGGASAFVESTRLLTKDQLVYALRLTGAKLKDVRQKAVKGVDSSQ